jgi:hypothetical protein
MNDIGIDARLSNISIISTKRSKQPVGFGTDSVGASLAQKGWMGSWQDRNVSGGISSSLQALVILAGSSDNALRAHY